MSGIVEVFHGGVESLVQALDRGQDFYYPQHGRLLTATFSSDIRYAVIMSSEFTREKEYVTRWEMPTTLLTLIELGAEGVAWFAPNLLVNSLEDLPSEYLRTYLERDRKRRFPSRQHLEIAFKKGEIVFTRAPHEYYRGAEAVDEVLKRFDRDNCK